MTFLLHFWNVELNPKNAQIVHVIGGVVGGGLSKSTDGGQSWRTQDAPGTSLSIDPINPNRLLALSLFGNRLNISNDAGKTWRPFDTTGLQVNRQDVDYTEIRSPFFSPREPKVLYAATNGVKTYTQR